MVRVSYRIIVGGGGVGGGGHCVCFNEALSGGWYLTRVLYFCQKTYMY